jgi:hypothetical protein
LFLLSIAIHVQEYCIDCNSHLPSSFVRVRRHRCVGCQEKHQSAPPPSSSPSPTSPPPLPPPLFGREPSVGHPLSSIERAAAVTLTRIGETQQHTAERIGCTRQTVSHWQHTFAETGEVKDAPRGGRPRETTELEQRKRDYTDEDRRKRLSFAEGYKNWKEDDWDRVLFADEAIIEGKGGKSGGRHWVRRPPGTMEAIKPEYTRDKQAHPVKLNVWACFSGRGLGYCCIYNESLDGPGLKRILNTHLLPSARLLFNQHPPEPWWLLQDNAPTHTSTVVKTWLHNHGVSCLDFPPYSPDLNAIENVWSDIERRVNERGPRTVEELQDMIAEEWAATSPQLLKTLAHSMIKRCKAVISVQGEHIRY